MGEELNRYLTVTREHLDLLALSLKKHEVPEEVALRALQLEVVPKYVGLFDTEGSLVWSASFSTSSPFLGTGAITSRPFFITAVRGREYVGQPQRDNEGRQVVEWSLPVMRGQGSTTQDLVLYALVDLEPVIEVLSAQNEVAAYVVDTNGKPLMVNQYTADNQLDIGPARGIVAAFLAQRSGIFNFTTPEGERVLSTWVQIRNVPWAAVVEVPSRIIFEGVYFSLFLIIVLLAIVVIMLLYIMFFFNRSILSPIEKIQKNIIAFAQGDLTSRTKLESRNELGVLARTFNDMADRIADEPKRLQEQVDNRTEELAAANEKLQELVKEARENTKTLLRKEHDLLEANDELKRLNKEMDQVSKVLVRRDRDLTEANTRLEEMDKVKSEFVSIAAHQLRTPLTAVKWSLKGLKDGEFGKLDDEQQEAVTNGLKAAEGAIDLINDLLDTARIEGGRFGFHFDVGPLAPVVFDMLERLKPRAEHKGITIIPPKIPHDLLLRRDAERLGMALENSVDNGIKYTEPGGKITVTVKADEETITIMTQDTGIGIPKDHQHRLFDKFFRAPNAMLMQTSGTGLGLYLMKNIIESHDGTVRIESKEKEGTKVIYELPRVKKPEK